MWTVTGTATAILAVSIVAATAAFNQQPTQAANDHGDAVVYEPVQSISAVVGGKSAIGYFRRDGKECRVTLMISEVFDPETEVPTAPARVHFTLSAGQGAGLDVEGGDSLAMTCGSYARTLLVRRDASTEGVTVTQ